MKYFLTIYYNSKKKLKTTINKIIMQIWLIIN